MPISIAEILVRSVGSVLSLTCITVSHIPMIFFLFPVYSATFQHSLITHSQSLQSFVISFNQGLNMLFPELTPKPNAALEYFNYEFEPHYSR